MKILVGICNSGVIHAQTVVSLIGALNKLNGEGNIDYKVSMQIGGDKPRGMNMLAKETLDEDYDYLMSIDSDMIFPADGILKLIENDKDIVGANYAVRGNSINGAAREAVIKMANKKGKKIEMPVTDLPKRLFKCRALGNGFTLYKRKVFAGAPRPYFRNIEHEDGTWSTEDVLFMEEAQDKGGFEVWCNPTIEMGHIGTTNYTL